MLCCAGICIVRQQGQQQQQLLRAVSAFENLMHQTFCSINHMTPMQLVGCTYVHASVNAHVQLCTVLGNKVMAKSSYIYRECMRPAKRDAHIQRDDQLGFLHTCTEAAKGKTV